MINAKLRFIMRERQSRTSDYNAPSLVKRIPDDLAGLRLDQALARMFPEHSRSRLQAWLREGHIQLDASAAKPKQKIWGGERIEVRPQPDSTETSFRAEPIALNIVYEDEALLVVNKPAGLVVHPGSGNWQGTMLNALLHHLPQLQGVPRAGIVHRLDKDTTGLLVVAKTLEAQTSLVRQLQARTVKREYLALVHGAVTSDGEVATSVGRHPSQRTRMAVTGGGKPALTYYRVLKRFEGATLIECSLATGRTHQIRVHMQSLGHALVGDPVYGGVREGKNAIRFARQALHAARLAFIHPISDERMQFEAPLPQDMRSLLNEIE